MVWLRNPSTKRKILKGGATYRRLMKEGENVNTFEKTSPPRRRKVLSPRRRSPVRRNKGLSPRRRSPVRRRKGLSPRRRSPIGRKRISPARRRSPNRQRYDHEELSMGPRKTKRGKVISPLPNKSKVMDLRVANPRSLESTLRSTPRSRRRIRDKLQQSIRKEKRESKKSATRGWNAAKPQKGRERNELFDKCGEACFLQPRTKGFPICAALREGQGCKIDCRGLASAEVRAGQWGYDNVEKFADDVYNKKCIKRR